MGEIAKVYLYSKIPLTSEQEAESLADIYRHTEEGFQIELQREVYAHTSEETYMFLVRKIEPEGKFYGKVDKDTVFEIMHDDRALPASKPIVEAIEESVRLAEESTNESWLLFTEVGRLKPFIDELETLRNKYDISWDCLHKIVEALETFGNETAPRL